MVEESKHRLIDRLHREVGDTKVVQSMERVPREAFVLPESARLVYEDVALPIGQGQAISQPYIVALMVSALDLRRTDKVLEIGTGSGYQAAVLAELVWRLVTVERIKTLADSARNRLESLGYSNVEVHLAEKALGWPQEAPYNAIIVAVGAPTLPRRLISQMVVGGRLVVPVGSKMEQELMKVSRTPDGFSVRTLGLCRFVPLIGKGAWSEEKDEA